MTWTCPDCGFVLKVLPKGGIERFTCRCKAAGPDIVTRAVNFTQSVVQHAASGFAVVSPEQRAKRLAVCQGCEQFNGKICTHSKCGCGINNEAGFIDKLNWRSSTCPLNKWPTLDAP